jgi:pimeloyl-ACP methyl ester carboxylesterase
MTSEGALGDGEQLLDAGRGVQLCWTAAGDPADPSLLLVGGLGQQLVAWPEGFVDALVAARLYVVRFDNRDVGRSTHFRAIPPPSTMRLLAARFVPQQYALADMADDAAALVDGLGLAPAHVVGVSMGGMIGQTLAVRRPDAVRSLTSIMSTTGAAKVGRPAKSTMRLLAAKPTRDRQKAIDRSVTMFRHIGSSGFPFDEQFVRTVAGLAYDRGHDPAGTGRQLAAILKSGDRTPQLASVAAPTLVIHGDRDRMVNPTGGAATAAAIRGARLETIPGMGHDLPAEAVPRLVELIAGHARAADAAAPAQEAVA